MPTDRSPQERLAGLTAGPPAARDAPSAGEDVPAAPTSAPPPTPYVGGEAAAVRRRALAAATSAYAATYGHPLVHETSTGPLRWGTTARTAVVVASALALLGLGVVAHTLVGAPSTVVVGEPVVPGPPTPAVPGDGWVEGVAGEAAGGTGAAGEPSGTGEVQGPADDVVVHVVGQVHDPGVVELPAGARVVDAVTAAGGATTDADLSGLNLARPVVDGEQVLVPRPGEEAPEAAPGGGEEGGDGGPGASPGGPTARVDLNRATAAELEALPGIGPVLAERIVAHRDEHGAFASVDALQAVRGVGPSLLAELRDLVTA